MNETVRQTLQFRFDEITDDIDRLEAHVANRRALIEQDERALRDLRQQQEDLRTTLFIREAVGS